MATEMKRVVVYLPDSVYEKLTRLARTLKSKRARHGSISREIRRILETALIREEL